MYLMSPYDVTICGSYHYMWIISLSVHPVTMQTNLHICTKCHYSRTSMARTLMARLPRLVRTRSWVPWNKFHSCRFRIVFFFILRNGILCVLIRIASVIEKTSLLYHLTWRIINPQWLELPLSRTIFHSPKGVRAIEVRLYMFYVFIMLIYVHNFSICKKHHHMYFVRKSYNDGAAFKRTEDSCKFRK